MDARAAPAAAPLSHDAALAWPGTLLAPDGMLVAPYDLERTGRSATGLVPAAPALGLLHAARRPFRLAYGAGMHVHVVNGMGVALGDSIVGLSALAALLDAHPGLRFTLYRPAAAPRYVEALYVLASCGTRISISAGRPHVSARSSAGAKSAVRSTVSPCAPNARA